MSVYEEWMDLQLQLVKTLSENLRKFTPGMVLGSPELMGVDRYKELFDVWMKQFEAFFSSMSIPAFGPMKETLGQYEGIIKSSIKIGESYTKLYLNWMDLQGKLNRGWMEASQNFSQKALESKGKPLDPEGMKGLYNIWIETFEKTFDRLFRTDEFSSSLGEFVNSIIDIRRLTVELMDEYHKMVGLPTKAQFDEIYDEINRLKRQIKEVSRGIKEGGGEEK